MPYKSISAVVASSNNVSTPLTLTPVLPARANGDLLIAITTSRSNTAAVATPAGWTLWPGFPKRSATVSGGTIYVFYKEVVGGEANPGLVWSNLTTGTTGDSCQAVVACFDRVEVASPSDVTPPTATDASSANPSIPTLTTVSDDAEVIGIALKVSDTGQTGTIANSFTERGDFHTTTGTGHHLYIATRTMAAPGATGASVVTESNGTAARCLAVALAVKERIPVTYFGVVSKSFVFGATVAGRVLPPFPTVSVVDNFDGRDEQPPAAPWKGSFAADGFHVIAGILLNPSGVWDGMYWDVPYTADQECFITIPQLATIPNTSHMQLHVHRDQVADTSYFLNIQNISPGTYGWSLYRRIAGSDVSLKSMARGMSDGDSVGISIKGSEIYVWHKYQANPWVLILSTTDTNIPAAGVTAIYTNDSTWHFDNWGATPAAAVTHYGATSLAIAFSAATAGDIPAPPGAYVTEVLADNPISYWRLGNNVTIHDEMNVSPDVTAAGGWTDVGLLTGDTDASILFDGSDDAIEIPNIAAHNVSSGSLEIWMKSIESGVGGSYRALICKTEAFGIFMLDNQLMTYDWGGGGNQLTGVFLNDNVRHHVVLTFQSGVAGGSRFYVDGVAVGSPFQITILDPAEPLTIAKNSNTQFFRGNLDEAAFYGTVLTPTRIAAHYNAGIAVPAGVTHYGAISAQYIFTKDIKAIRKTFGQLALPVIFSKDVNGRRKAFGQLALPITFLKDVKGQRKTFGQLLSPFTFGKAVAGTRQTFGQTSLSITAAIATAGFRAGLRLYGASSLSVIFGKDVRGQRKAFGQVAMPLTFTKDVRGQRKTFGQITFPITFTKEAVGRKNVFGQLSMQTLFGKEIAGRRKTFSQIVMPMTFSKAVAGRKQTFGKTVLPIGVTIVVDGYSFVGPKTYFSSISLPVIFGKQVTARRKTFGQVTAPFIFGKALQGQRKTFSQLDLLLDFETIIKSGPVGVHGAVELELVLTMDTNGILRPTAIILNDAAGVYLGTIPVQAVYVGGQKVWQLVNV